MPLAHRSSTDTPSGLRGLESLKGSDRVVGRLLYDAMRCTRDIQQAPDLAALCADTLIKTNPQAYKDLDEDAIQLRMMEDAKAHSQVASSPPEFDAFLTLVGMWQEGECSPNDPLYTLGPMIPLAPGGAMPDSADPPNWSDTGNMQRRRGDLDFAFEQLFGGGGFIDWDAHDNGEEDGFALAGVREGWAQDAAEREMVANGATNIDKDNWWSVDSMSAPGKSSIVIKDAEVLVASEVVRESIAKNKEARSELMDRVPGSVEYLGNGCPFPGQAYARAAIVFWPRANRAQIKEEIGKTSLDRYGSDF